MSILRLETATGSETLKRHLCLYACPTNAFKQTVFSHAAVTQGNAGPHCPTL